MPIILTMLAAAVAAATAGAPITDPQWEQPKFSAADLQKDYPPAALAQGVSGAAALECTVTASGGLDPCKVLAEKPEGLQFGDAAIKVASRFKMKPVTRSGASAVGRVVRLPIAFNFTWSAQAPDPRPGFTVTAGPRWLHRLDEGSIQRVYPDNAHRHNADGEAILHCQVLPDGHLSNCTKGAETPMGDDFGEAALLLWAKLQLDVHDPLAAGVVGKTIDLPITFHLALR